MLYIVLYLFNNTLYSIHIQLLKNLVFHTWYTTEEQWKHLLPHLWPWITSSNPTKQLSQISITESETNFYYSSKWKIDSVLKTQSKNKLLCLIYTYDIKQFLLYRNVKVYENVFPTWMVRSTTYFDRNNINKNFGLLLTKFC